MLLFISSKIYSHIGKMTTEQVQVNYQYSSHDPVLLTTVPKAGPREQKSCFHSEVFYS